MYRPITLTKMNWIKNSPYIYNLEREELIDYPNESIVMTKEELLSLQDMIIKILQEG